MIYIHETADHAVSVTHPAEFTDGTVALKFMLEDDRQLVEQICTRLLPRRGIYVDPGQILLASGLQQACYLLFN